MIKTYRLKNLLMGGQITGEELEALLQKKDYLGALYDLRSDKAWMADLLANPMAAKLIAASAAAVRGLLAFAPSKKDLFASSIARSELFASEAALRVITADADVANELCRTESYATEIVASQLCRTEFFAAETGLNALFNQPASLMAIWNSSPALKHIEATDTVIDWLLSHKTKSGTAYFNPDLTSKKSIVVTTKFHQLQSYAYLATLAGGSIGEEPFKATTTEVQRKIRAHSNINIFQSSGGLTATVHYFEVE